jgi:hypothetical protein
MALALASAIRDRAHALVEPLTPALLAGDKFRKYRNEGKGNLEDWAETNAANCLRRFQIREVSDVEPPTTSNLTEERVILTLEFRMAYPKTHRYGADNALDRDDVMNSDWKQIKYELCGTGGDARSNFTTSTAGSYDCTPLPALRQPLERTEKIDYLVATLRYEYLRSTT